MIKDVINNHKKKIIIVGTIATALFFVVLLRNNVDQSKFVYEYEKVAVGEISKSISTTGNVDLLDPVSIMSQINGVVVRILVDFNDTVKRNQLLAVIDAGDLQNEITKMQKTMERMNIDRKNLENDLQVKRNMYKENMISISALELAEDEFKKMNLSYTQVRVDYNNLLQMKNNTRIYAPISGIIVSRDVNESDPVVRNKRLFLMVKDLKKNILSIVIDETDIGKVRNGQKISFTVSAYPDQVFSGTISQVRFNPINRGGVITYDAIAICDNAQYLLKPGMTAIVTIEVDTKQNVMKIPNDALAVIPPIIDDFTLDKDKKYVWKKKKDNQIVPVEIQTGLVGDVSTEVKSGKLKTGDKVLVRARKQISIN